MGGVTRYITKNILIFLASIPNSGGDDNKLAYCQYLIGPSGFINCKNMCEVYLRLAVTMETSTDLL